MMHLIYLKVAKVGTQNADMTTSIERTVITLESGKNFNSFVKHLHIQNFLTSEAERPHVIKVVEWENGKPGKEIDSAEYVKQVNDALSSVNKSGQPVDYKALSEKQSAKISEMESLMQSFNERLIASETKTVIDVDKSNDRIALEEKATKLNIEFRSNIGDAKLLEKIKAIEPEYNIN